MASVRWRSASDGVARGGVVGRHQVVGVARGRLPAEVALEASARLFEPAEEEQSRADVDVVVGRLGIEGLGAQERLVRGVVVDRGELERGQVEPALTLRGVELEGAPQVLLSGLELTEQEAGGRAQK